MVMNKAKVIEGVCQMRFEDIYDRHEQKRLTCEEAAELLGISIKTFYRKRQRYEEEDFNGVFDRRIGKASSHRAAGSEVTSLIRLYSERYRGFSVKHFHEFAIREEGVKRSYSWTKNKLLEKGLIQKSTRGGKHRLRRERKPMRGMMIHQDGSTHRWIQALDYDIDLIVTMDDASSDITSCFLVPEEGTESTFRGLKETIQQYGLFCSFYTDRGSHYFYTPEAGGRVDRSRMTQVGRALKQLGIKHIAAYSPEARGRSERMFGTLQDRLPKELALRNITTIEEANRYIQEEYLPRHNAQFTVQPLSPETAFTPCPATISLNDVLCIEEERTVQRDNTVRYNGFILQIPQNEYRYHYVKVPVTVHEYLDHTMAMFYGPLCIGRYDQQGQIIVNNKTKNDQSKKRSKRSTTPFPTSVGLQPPSVGNGDYLYQSFMKKEGSYAIKHFNKSDR